MISIPIRSNGSERVRYDYENYPAYIRNGHLSHYRNHRAISHWHDEVEFIYLLSGRMQYNVNGEVIRLEEGSGIFVNTGQLHFGYSDAQEECVFLCVLLHPLLLCATETLDETYVAPLLANEAFPYLYLDDRTPWQAEILRSVAEIYEARELSAAPLRIQSAFFKIWSLLTEHAPPSPFKQTKADGGVPLLKDMLLFIQNNYSEKLRLADIAGAALVSKSTCLSMFKKFMQTTPTSFLNGYRLKRAGYLLHHSDLSVTEIAFHCGFQGSSYFAESFRKEYGCTPREYRLKT